MKHLIERLEAKLDNQVQIEVAENYY